MQDYSLNVEIRTERGKNACHRLRDIGYIPAVIYSHGISEAIKVQKKDFLKLFKKRISESVLIDLNIINKEEDSTHQVFIKDYQRDPITDNLLHLDFYKVKEGEKIHTMVPIEINGTAAGVKMGGILELLERELEVECLPVDMPEKIPIDVTDLQIGDSIHIEDIQFPDTIQFLQACDRVIVTLLAPHKIEEEVVEEVEEEVKAAGEEDAVVEEPKKGDKDQESKE
ncbi:MAG: 50S ribosomal protein L25/general stress protein Ctc [Spirochaetota bacterium]|nr:50S ribosomal protein L25/general stress protein Ctc [Spirochaetota bacterium]